MNGHKMKPVETQQPVRGTLRLDASEIGQILDNLDLMAGNQGVERRRLTRHPFRNHKVELLVWQLGANTPVKKEVSSRNLSASGIALLHGGFVHIGSICAVRLTALNGGVISIPGRIVRCRLVEKTIHEIAVRFDHDVDPSLFCKAAVTRKVLLADDDDLLASIVTRQLSKMSVKVSRALNGVEAVNMACQANYDIILMDMQMPQMDGVEACVQLRSRGYSGVIAAFTTFDTKEDYDRLMAQGFDYCLTKPHTKQSIELLLSALQDQPLTSSMADNQEMAEFIDAFVDDVTHKVSLMENALANSDLEQLHFLIDQIKGAGSVVGFEDISNQAAAILGKLRAGDQLVGVQGDIQGLIKLCRRVRSNRISTH